MTLNFWPFSTRGSRVEYGASPQPDAPLLDFTAYAVNDACIKVWLPEKLIKALDGLSARNNASRPDVLRRLIFEHVHGKDGFDALLAWKTRQDTAKLQRLEEPPTDGGVQFSTRRNTIAMFGKASEDFKLWLPTPLKQDLEALARADGQGLSDYLRKTLVRILLGEKTYMKWQVVIGAVPAEWVAFERDPY